MTHSAFPSLSDLAVIAALLLASGGQAANHATNQAAALSANELAPTMHSIDSLDPITDPTKVRESR